MNHYKAQYPVEGGTETVEYDATHFSISSAGTATFWRRSDGAGAKDELVGSVGTPVTVRLDETTGVLELTGQHLGDELAEAVMEALDIDSLPDGQKIRVAVTLL